MALVDAFSTLGSWTVTGAMPGRERRRELGCSADAAGAAQYALMVRYASGLVHPWMTA
jgi:hypothetical protein